MTLLRESLGSVLREHREESCTSIRELSARSGVSLSYISEVERGIKDPSSEMLEDLCNGLGLTVEDLLACALGRAS